MIKKRWDDKYKQWNETVSSQAYFKTPQDRRKAVEEIKKRRGPRMVFADLLPLAQKVHKYDIIKRRQAIRNRIYSLLKEKYPNYFQAIFDRVYKELTEQETWNYHTAQYQHNYIRQNVIKLLYANNLAMYKKLDLMAQEDIKKYPDRRVNNGKKPKQYI